MYLPTPFLSPSSLRAQGTLAVPSPGRARSRCHTPATAPPTSPPPPPPDTLQPLFKSALSTTISSSSRSTFSFSLFSRFSRFLPGLVSSLVSPADRNGLAVTSSTTRRNPSSDRAILNADPPSQIPLNLATRNGGLPILTMTTPPSHTLVSSAAKTRKIANSPSRPIAGLGRVFIEGPPLFWESRWTRGFLLADASFYFLTPPSFFSPHCTNPILSKTTYAQVTYPPHRFQSSSRSPLRITSSESSCR